MLSTRLVPCSASAGCAASRSASLRASGSSSSGAVARVASPSSTAVAAGMRSPVNRYSRERRIGVSSGQNAAPPSPATRPTATCGSARYASLRDQHDVAQHGQAAAQADGRAVDRGDHRQREAEHLLDDLRAFPQALVPGHRVVEERGDPVQVAAGAERPPGAGEDHHPGRRVSAASCRQTLASAQCSGWLTAFSSAGRLMVHGADRAVGLDGQFREAGRRSCGSSHR